MIENVRGDLSRTADTARNEMDALLWLVRTAVIGAALAAVYTELRKPPAERTWNGRLLGAIPYDFRLPTIERIKTAYWNPRSPRIFTDRPLGIGWAVNIPTVLRRLGVRTGFTKAR
jgi:hypothetical protein